MMNKKVGAVADSPMDPGMAVRKRVYNALYDDGVFLPPFCSACITVASLMNMNRPGQFYVYYSSDVKAELCVDKILIAPLIDVYDFIQKFHMQKYKRPLPFQVTPPGSFMKPILRIIDPENNKQYLQKSDGYSYKNNLAQVMNPVFVYKPAQEQRMQNIVDQAVKNATRIHNMKIGIHFPDIEIEKTFVNLRALIRAENVKKFNEIDKCLFPTKNALGIYEMIESNIMDIEVEDDEVKIETTVDPAVRQDFNQSDASVDPGYDASLAPIRAIFEKEAEKPRDTAEARSTIIGATARFGDGKTDSGASINVPSRITRKKK